MTARPASPARRRLLGGAAALWAVGFLPGCVLPVIPKRPAPTRDAAAGWIRYEGGHEGGRYTLVVPRVEMGQQVATALARIACVELGIDDARLEVRLHGSADIERVRATVGSESVRDYALPLAMACATLRDALAAGLAPHELPQSRPASALRWLQRAAGAAPPRLPMVQGREIVTGAPLYAADVRRPGQRHGRVLRAPASAELRSRLRSFDEAAARAVAGFVAIVRDERLALGAAEGLGIVAETPAALDRIEAALAPQWDVEGGFGAGDIDAAIDIDRHLARSAARRHRVLDEGRIDTDAAWDVDLRIDVPLAAHGAIEARCAVAEPAADGSLQLWVGSQDVFYQRDVVARRLGLAEQQVVVHGRRVGGAFGGRTICTVELEAALLAVAVAAPVKVQWTRAQEFRQGFHRPPSSHRIRARMAEGRLREWRHDFAGSHILFTNAALPPWLQRLTDFVGDDGVARGAALPYRADARQVGFDLVRLPVFTGPWRGLGAGPNGIAIESAIDECARHAGADPVRFRLDHLDDPRLAHCLRRVAELSHWHAAGDTPPAAAAGRRSGRGVACGIYKAMSYVAVVAEVEVDAAAGRVQVTRMWCTHDCGRIVDAGSVRAQCEGNLVWGLGMVLVEALPVAASQVAAATFGDAPIPRLTDVPPMEIELIDGGGPPGGAGETAIVAAGAAVANAVRAAVGLRVHRLPLRPADLRAVAAGYAGDPVRSGGTPPAPPTGPR